MKAPGRRRYFTPAVDKYFAAWILKSTCFTGHPFDERRFYRFVLAVHKLSKPVAVRDEDGNLVDNRGRNPRTHDKAQFRAKIVEAVNRNGGFDADHLEIYASEYADRAMMLLEFLWETRHGLPRVDQWNPPLK